MTAGVCHWLLKPGRLDPPSSSKERRSDNLTLIEHLLCARSSPKCFTSIIIEFSMIILNDNDNEPWKEGQVIIPISQVKPRFKET